MNITNDIEFLQQGQFSSFKIKTQGQDLPTGFKAFNIPEGMTLYSSDGWIYGTPIKEESLKSIFVAQGEQDNTYKFVDVIVKDFTFFKEFKNKLKNLGIPEEINISEIENFNQRLYFKNLEVNNLINSLPINITGFRHSTGLNVNINLDLILSGFYKETGYSGYGGWWTNICENPPWCDGITTGNDQFDFINNSTGQNFIFSVVENFGKTKITGWSDNTDGNAIDGNRITGALLISAGYNHSLALLDNFILTGWGNNQHGKVYGTTGATNIDLSPMRQLTGVAGISAGSGHSLALLFDKKITGWGLNNYGQVSGSILGGNWSTNPAAVLTGVRQVNAGGSHSLALLSNRRVTGWGLNNYGQATGGNNLTGVIQISAGLEHSLALLNNHKITGWGNNEYGQVSGTTLYTSWEDTPVGKLNGVVKIEAGGYHGLALLSNGKITGWGLNNYGQADIFCAQVNTGNCQSTIQIPLCFPGTSYSANIGFDEEGCPIYTCIPCPNSPSSCGEPPFPEGTIVGADANGCPIYECLCDQSNCTANQAIVSFYERQDSLGTMNLVLTPTSLGWTPSTTQILWGDLMPLNKALAERLPSDYLNSVQPWVISHTFLTETPTTVAVQSTLIGYDISNCPIFICKVILRLSEQRAVNLRNVLNLAPSSFSGVEIVFQFEGNTGASEEDPSLPAIDTGDWEPGTVLKIENGPLIGGGCNPIAGVIAGRGEGYCGPGPEGTAAIHVRSNIQLVIINKGKIGGGGGAGGDGDSCGEGGPGAGIPAGENNGGGGGACCGGESDASILCGGNGGGNSGNGGNLGNRGNCGSSCPNNASPAIRLASGASYLFDANSINPFFEGEGIVGAL